MEKTVDVQEQSQIAEVRRMAAELGRAEHMDVTEMGRVALIATEVATNLVKYATRGTVSVSRYREGGETGVELVASDEGPGFHDFAAAARDGHSTGGSMGIGLGSIARASSFFDVYTVPGEGTVLMARVGKARSRAAARQDEAINSPLIVAARTLPMKGEFENGDAWKARKLGRRQVLCIVDGLGHGPNAAVAAAAAIAVFDAAGNNDSPEEIIRRAHEALRETRGAVMAILAIDAAAGTASFCGIGNIAAAVYHESEARHLLSAEGIVGYNLRTLQGQDIVWPRGGIAVLSTDGLAGRLKVGKNPQLLGRHPALIASVLFRDHAKTTDDATVVVAKEA